MLTRVVYLSTATRLLGADQLESILAISRRNNGRDGITGLLLYDDGNFIQAIEGEPAAIERLMARLSGDPRHRGIQVVSTEAVASRLFSDWAMEAQRLDRVAQLPLAASGANIAPIMLNAFLRNVGTTATGVRLQP
jgi:hypothetical protein